MTPEQLAAIRAAARQVADRDTPGQDGQKRGDLWLRQGVVQSISGSTLGLTLGGDTTVITGVLRLAGVMPAVGQTVWCLKDGPDLIVLGPVAGQGIVPAAQARRTANQTIATATDTAITWQATDWNVGPLWSAGNPTRLTAVAPGLHVGRAVVRWATAVSAAERYACVRINGVALSRAGEQGVAPSGGVVTLDFPWEANLVVGDYVEVVAFHSTGANLDVTPTFTWSVSLSMRWVASTPT